MSDLPRREPFATLINEPPRRSGLPAWAWVSLVLGSIALCVSGSILMQAVKPIETEPVTPAPPAPVTVSGACEKRIIGSYGLVATVIVTNTTVNAQPGVVWVRWPVTGEVTQEYTKRLTLAPGAQVEFPVNEPVSADRWTRTGLCSYGWTPSG